MGFFSSIGNAFSSVGKAISTGVKAVGQAGNWATSNIIKPVAQVALPIAAAGLGFINPKLGELGGAVSNGMLGLMGGSGGPEPPSPVFTMSSPLGGLDGGAMQALTGSGLGALAAQLAPPTTNMASLVVAEQRAAATGAPSPNPSLAYTAQPTSGGGILKWLSEWSGIGDGKPGIFGIGDGKPGIFGIGTGKAKARKAAEEAAKAAGYPPDKIKEFGDKAAASVGEPDDEKGSALPWLVGAGLLLLGLG